MRGRRPHGSGRFHDPVELFVLGLQRKQRLERFLEFDQLFELDQLQLFVVERRRRWLLEQQLFVEQQLVVLIERLAG